MKVYIYYKKEQLSRSFLKNLKTELHRKDLLEQVVFYEAVWGFYPADLMRLFPRGTMNDFDGIGPGLAIEYDQHWDETEMRYMYIVDPTHHPLVRKSLKQEAASMHNLGAEASERSVIAHCVRLIEILVPILAAK